MEGTKIKSKEEYKKKYSNGADGDVVIKAKKETETERVE